MGCVNRLHVAINEQDQVIPGQHDATKINYGKISLRRVFNASTITLSPSVRSKGERHIRQGGGSS